MGFIKDSDGYVIIPEGFNQIFKNALSVKTNETQILKLKTSGTLTNKDVCLAEFLFDLKFATERQLVEYCKTVPLFDDEEDIPKFLNRMVRHRVLNKFYLDEEEDDGKQKRWPNKALEIYCLELGGIHLLASFSDRDIYEWTTATIRKGSVLIGKQLLSTEMYIKARQTCVNKLEYYRNMPRYQVGVVSLGATFHFCLNDNGKRSYFIGEVFRESDNIADIREKLIKLESLLETKAWMKYYPDSEKAPILFLFTDSLELANIVGREVMQTTKITRFRMSTDLNLSQKMLNEKGAFLKYNETTDSIEEIKASMF